MKSEPKTPAATSVTPVNASAEPLKSEANGNVATAEATTAAENTEKNA